MAAESDISQNKIVSDEAQNYEDEYSELSSRISKLAPRLLRLPYSESAKKKQQLLLLSSISTLFLTKGLIDVTTGQILGLQIRFSNIDSILIILGSLVLYSFVTFVFAIFIDLTLQKHYIRSVLNSMRKEFLEPMIDRVTKIDDQTNMLKIELETLEAEKNRICQICKESSNGKPNICEGNKLVPILDELKSKVNLHMNSVMSKWELAKTSDKLLIHWHTITVVHLILEVILPIALGLWAIISVGTGLHIFS